MTIVVDDDGNSFVLKLRVFQFIFIIYFFSIHYFRTIYKKKIKEKERERERTITFLLLLKTMKIIGRGTKIEEIEGDETKQSLPAYGNPRLIFNFYTHESMYIYIYI